MSVKNGSFETFVKSSPIQNNDDSYSTNPFGLKDFSKFLDNKFGNSAFSDNILAVPNIKNVNPFDEGGWQKPNLYDKVSPMPKNRINSPYTPYPNPKSNPKPNSENFKTKSVSIYTEASNSLIAKEQEYMQENLFTGFNKGTGMACGGRSKHKLDFCY